MSKHYILKGDVPVEADLITWANWYDKTDNHVAFDEIGEIQVSTVFLGLDHNFTPDGAPILYETMVFGGPLDQEQERYRTLHEAKAGHQKMIERVREAADTARE